MNSKRPLVPPFLNRLDHHLLINKPEVWSARTHLVVYYGLLFIAVLTLLSFIIPNDPRSASPVFYWVGFVVVISFIALIGWLIYLLRFNVFKRYGHSTPLSRLTTFVLYFIAAGTLILFPFVMPGVESIRANRAYSDQEIGNDVNAINTKICQLEYDSLPHNLEADTILVVNNVPAYRSLPEEDAEEAITTTPYHHYRYRLVDTASIREELSGADSSVRMNDSMYVLHKSKNYVFVRSYAGYYAEHEMYASYDLYKKIIRNFIPPNRRAVRAGLYRLLSKYRLDETTSNLYPYESDKDIYQKISNKYGLYAIGRNIDHIVERKYRWRGENVSFIIRLYYYATLFVTLLVFTYRHSTRKTFFLSLLTAVVLAIFTSLFGAYFTPRDSSFFLWLISYTVLFFAISLAGFKNKVRRPVTGIGINLFVFMVVLFPVCLVAYYYAIIEQKNTRLAIDYEAMHRNIWYAEIAGPLLLLVLLATYIRRVYRKWYALPEE